MSFQESASDVSRMNREAARAAVAVHPHTMRVLTCAARMARLSGGVFDASIGGALVEWGLLASPAGTRPHRDATFRDIELRGNRVYFKRPLWVDLSGIAKGYAVDRAVAALRAAGIRSACVNAGGDLRILGAEPERVAIRTAAAACAALAVIDLRGGALATSCGADLSRVHAGVRVGAHLCGRTRQPCDPRATVSVHAARCIIADALTKIVLADASAAALLLRRFHAVAYLHHPDATGSCWRKVAAQP